MLNAFTILYLLYSSTYLDIFTDALKCEPLNNVYYQKQLRECLQCAKCPVGMGKITLEESAIEIDSNNGPSTCIPCRPCKTGYYSDVHAYKCKICTNCTLLNMFPLKPCRRDADATCHKQKPIVNISSSNDEDTTTLSTYQELTPPASTTNVLVIFLPVVMVVCLLGFGIVGWLIWKRRRANGATSDIHTDEENECTPLIVQERPRHKIKRRRHDTYPFGEISLKDKEPAPAVSDNSCCNRHSHPYDNWKEIVLYSYNNNPNTVAGSGFTNFTLRTEPHNILKSFNIQDKAPIIKKVNEWDLKYRRSNTPKVSKPMSAFSFLTCHASDRPDILEKVQSWEMKEDLLTVPYMSKVARHLGPGYKFRSFAREAGLSETDLTNIQQNYKDDVVEQGYQVLQKLKQKDIIKTELDVINIIEHLGSNNILTKISC